MWLSATEGGARDDHSMMRFLFFVFVLTGAMQAAGEPGRRGLDAARHHLGVAGLPEWQEFEASPPHGRQLDVSFSAQANAQENTLFLWQRNVKTTWNVLLNGRKLGALEALAQPLVLALPIPAGLLKDGENRLSIVRPPSPMLDDIVVGEIALDPRPRDDALAEAVLDVAVTDAESGAAVPCRLTLVEAAGEALAPLSAAPGQRLAVRTGVVYTGDGQARLGARAGGRTVTLGWPHMVQFTSS